MGALLAPMMTIVGMGCKPRRTAERGFVMGTSKMPFFARRRKNTFTRQAFAYRMSVIDVERCWRGVFMEF
jgi:hypothetical protein